MMRCLLPRGGRRIRGDNPVHEVLLGRSAGIGEGETGEFLEGGAWREPPVDLTVLIWAVPHGASKDGDAEKIFWHNTSQSHRTDLVTGDRLFRVVGDAS